MKDRFVIYNGGVSAYGTDQAYLRYTKRFDDIKPEMSFLGYATTDLIRNLSIQRMLLMGHSDEYLFLKPRFVLKSNQLELISPPETNFENLTDVLKSPETKRLLKQYDPFFEKCSILKQLIAITIRQCGFNIKIPLRIKKLRAEALRIVFGIIKKFIEFSRQRKTDGIILFLPIFRGAYKTGNDFDTLIHMLDRHGYPYVDLRNVFSDIERHDMEDFLTPKNHYTRLSGDWISDYLSDYITRRIGNTQRS
ncbi:MAG: hypothetical protein CMM60_06775 [Rhodospirillaceae bacterium]|nr:hypothetical protein [Rhodospirillaceae bacterium]